MERIISMAMSAMIGEISTIPRFGVIFLTIERNGSVAPKTNPYNRPCRKEGIHEKTTRAKMAKMSTWLNMSTNLMKNSRITRRIVTQHEGK